MYHLDFLLSIHLKSFEIANHKKDQRFFQARQDVETEVSPEDSSLGLVMAILPLVDPETLYMWATTLVAEQ